MKVICTQENLKAGLQTVNRIISSSNTLPILNNILIKTEGGLLKISSTNLEIAITTHIRCKVEEEGGITVFSKTMVELVNNLPNKNISLETKGNELLLETEQYHTAIKTLPAEEFPLIPNIDKKEETQIDSGLFKKAIEEVVFAVSTNQTQPEIAGILLGLDNGTLKLVATDRYRLAEKKITMPKTGNVSQEVIIPQKTLAELSRIIGTQKGQVEITINETQISFKFNDTEIISRLVDGQYPDYGQIIPTEFKTTAVIEKQSLVSALRAGAIFSQNTNSVKLDYDVDKQVVTLTTESQDLGKSVVDLPAELSGESGGVLLNHHYLLDCLQNIEGEKVIAKIINDGAPSLILPQDKQDYIYLVMPIKS